MCPHFEGCQLCVQPLCILYSEDFQCICGRCTDISNELGMGINVFFLPDLRRRIAQTVYTNDNDIARKSPCPLTSLDSTAKSVLSTSPTAKTLYGCPPDAGFNERLPLHETSNSRAVITQNAVLVFFICMLFGRRK